MTNNPSKLYIAGMGMITPVGWNVAMTAASVNAGICAYEASRYFTRSGEPITMARVPNPVFAEFDGEIEEGSRFSPRHDRVVKMAIIAIREACHPCTNKQAIPLVLALPDVEFNQDGLTPLIDALTTNNKPWITPSLSHSLYSGRASGIEGVGLAFKLNQDTPYPYFLVGGSDSHEDFARLATLDDSERLLTATSPDAFAPGEAACFLLLTPQVKLAREHNGYVIALHPPGLAEEEGHLLCDGIYRGDGLDHAFKAALINQPERSIHSVYSSMNGENHWAKEYGVAFLRNRTAFQDPLRFEHPADCYGDLGSATGTVLIALAAEHLLKNTNAKTHLVYSSSDSAKRGAVVVEKMALAPTNNNSIIKKL